MGHRAKVLTAVLLAALAGCQRATDPVARGREYFHAFGCVRCHAIGATGAHYGPDLSYIGFRKTAAWLDLWLGNPHAWKGHTVMPNLHLPESVRKDLVAFLAEQKGEAFARDGKPWEAPALAKDPIKRGETIFLHAGCVGCHGIAGVGGNPNNNVVGGEIPSLRGVRDRYNAEELVEKIRLGSIPGAANPHKPAPMVRMPVWGKVLLPAEMKALAAYLVTLDPVQVKGKKGAAEDF